MRRLLVVLCAACIFLGMAGFASAASVYVYDGGLGTWHDADKTSYSSTADPDGWMCWAAAASNALAWAGWYGLESDGVTPISSEDAIFAHFVNSWPNSTGNVMYGYDWWFENIDNDPNDNPTGDAGFYDDYDLTPPPFPGVYGGSWGTNHPEESWIAGYIADDRAIEIQIELSAFGGFSHSLTVWGMDEDANELYFTDSDDGANQLRTLDYYWDGSYLWLDDYTNSYLTTPTDGKIIQLVRLNRNTDDLTPSLINGPINGVPEPATIILLGIGLLGLGGFRRKE